MIKLRAATRLLITEQEMKDAGYKGPLGDSDRFKNIRCAALVLAADTGNFLFSFRSDKWDDQRTWSFWQTNDALAEQPSIAVKRVLRDETGFLDTPQYDRPEDEDRTYKLYSLSTLHDMNHGRFCYNFLAVFPRQFEPKLNDASTDFQWTPFGDWPSPLSFGAQFVLNDKDSLRTIRSQLRICNKGYNRL